MIGDKQVVASPRSNPDVVGGRRIHFPAAKSFMAESMGPEELVVPAGLAESSTLPKAAAITRTTRHTTKNAHCFFILAILS